MNGGINIILADDHQMLREGFKTMMRKQSEITIIDEAENGRELLELVDKHKPHIVITDIQMPIMDGIEACRKIKENHPGVGVIALSMFDSEHLIIDMLEAGAKGYLLKNTSRDEVVKAVKAVFDGGTYFCDNVSAKFTKMIAESKYNPYKPKKKIEFSEREISIIELTSKEFTNKEIASILNVSIRTIESTKERLQERVDAKNMLGVILYAVKHQVIRIDQ